MSIFSWPVALASVAVIVLAVVWYRGEVASRRAQSLAARSFIASRGRPVEGWPAVWAWSPVPSRRGTEPVLPVVQGPSPAGTDAPSGVSVEGVAPVVVGGAS